MQPAQATAPTQTAPKPKASPPKPGENVKGEQIDNQPFDLAVEVNDSEELESDEEDDEVNMMEEAK